MRIFLRRVQYIEQKHGLPLRTVFSFSPTERRDDGLCRKMSSIATRDHRAKSESGQHSQRGFIKTLRRGDGILLQDPVDDARSNFGGRDAPAALAPAISRDIAVPPAPRHSLLVRLIHWINAFNFLALLWSGIAILLAYPRMHWGKTGTVGMPSLFDLPFPFVLETGIRGPGRYLHFQSAWILFFSGLMYLVYGFRSGHFRKDLLPQKAERHFKAVFEDLVIHLQFKRPVPGEVRSYNLLQRLAYLAVIFILLPFMFVSGFAMSPSVTSVVPIDLLIFGGRQTARTLHFFCANLLVLFLLVHLFMVIVAGFVPLCREMITGYPSSRNPMHE
jgi:thiosulfate reductase cytochrome b subunit